MIHIERVLTRFNSYEDKHSLVIPTPTENALCLALVARFLLSFRSGYGDMRLCPLIAQLKAGGNLMPLVLAETVNNLDVLYENPTAEFMGSPVLLQIWLLERLKFVTPPEHTPYFPCQFTERARLYQSNNPIQHWIQELERVNVDTLAWTLVWYDFDEPCLRTRTYSCFCLCALYNTSFIYPARIMRQFGVVQDIPYTEHNPFPKQTLGADMLTRLKQNWYRFKKGLDSTRTYDLVPTEAYTRWYTREVRDREIDRTFRRQQICIGAPPDFEETISDFKTGTSRAPPDNKGKRKRR